MEIDGKWTLTLQAPLGVRVVTADFRTEGATLSGTLSGVQGSAPVAGTQDGSVLIFTSTIQGPMGPLSLTFKSTVVDDAITGTVTFGDFGSGDFSGTRA